jgi:predicted CoA-substrate-specific enzyme activase
LSPKIFAGIDIGSVFTKAVLFENGKVIAFETVISGGNYKAAANKVMNQLLAKASTSIESIAGIMTTGIGTTSGPFASRHVSDISCQAKGIIYLFPPARAVIDIGGQSIRAMRITPEGDVVDFIFSEKCAAGSGRFLQLIARILGIKFEDIGSLSLKSTKPVEFSTSCAVFSESETISRIAEGALKEDILAGVHKAIAAKVANLANMVKLDKDCGLTGGGAEDIGLVQTIREALGIKILVPEQPRITAALGAAVIASSV